MDEQARSPLQRYRQDLGSVIASSAAAYGYTLTVWSAGMVLSHAYGPPDPLQVFSFFGGAILAFAIVGALTFGGVTAEFGSESSRVELWGSFHFLSVGLGVGSAWLAASHVPSLAGWPLGAFLATAIYLFVVGAESSAADLKADSEG